MKVKQSEGSKCYIAVLNSSDSALPKAVLNASATVSSCSDLTKCYILSFLFWRNVWADLSKYL